MEASEERGWNSITFLNVEQEVESSLNVSGSDAEILDKYPMLRYVILIKRNHISSLKELNRFQLIFMSCYLSAIWQEARQFMTLNLSQ